MLVPGGAAALQHHQVDAVSSFLFAAAVIAAKPF